MKHLYFSRDKYFKCKHAFDIYEENEIYQNLYDAWAHVIDGKEAFRVKDRYICDGIVVQYEWLVEEYVKEPIIN